jgi:hypothetical protein
MDIADVLGKVAPAETVVAICVDGSIATRLEDLQQRLTEAHRFDLNHNQAATAPAVAAEIDALHAAARDATVEFRVRSIGASAWRRLVADYPPPADDVDDWRWHAELFPPAAVAACCVEPAMTEGQAQELADRLSNGAWTRLFGAVLNLNMRDDVPKFETGTGALLTTDPSSTTAPREESLTASSSA